MYVVIQKKKNTILHKKNPYCEAIINHNVLELSVENNTSFWTQKNSQQVG